MDLELVPLEAEDPEQEGHGMADKPKYEGEERRKEHRRQGHDRRALLRYEPGKEDRRSGDDRREEQGVWKNLYSI